MSSEAYNQPVWVALFQPIRLNRIVISSNKETISLKIKKIPIGEKQSNINQGLLYPQANDAYSPYFSKIGKFPPIVVLFRFSWLTRYFGSPSFNQ